MTLARILTDTYTAIAPTSVPGFLLGQVVGVVVAVGLIGLLYAPSRHDASNVLVPHPTTDPGVDNGDVDAAGPSGNGRAAAGAADPRHPKQEEDPDG